MIATKYLSLFFLFITITFGVTAQTKPTADIESFLKGRMEKRRIPGLQIAIVREGRIVMEGAYGVADIQNGIPVTEKTVFSINSATKSFTGVALMQLVEDGKLDLNAPVSRYLDGLPPLWQPITLKQLVTHVSGLPDILDFRSGGTGRLLGDGSEESAFAEVQRQPMDFPTGTKYRYNQTNYVLLGKVIDKITGKPFAKFINDRQFAAVGMTSAAFGDSRDLVPNRAQSYRYYSSADGTKIIGHAYDDFPQFLRTAGGINATASDIARWLIALDRGKLLKSKNVATLWTQGTFNDGTTSPWALGWPTIAREEHRAVAGIGGRRSAFYAYPEDDLAIVILTNLSGADPEGLIDEVAGHFLPSLLEANGGGLPADLKLLRAELVKRGFENAVGIANELKKKDSAFTLGENDLNVWGYRLIEDGKVREAIEVLKLNVTLYPASSNTYDSLAEAYETAGEKQLAIKNYRRSLELDPKNSHAEAKLKQL